jgi:ankyrin repeat protein
MAEDWQLAVTITLIICDIPATGWTPLHIAAWTGRKEVVGQLLDAGAAIDAANKVRPPSQQCADELRYVGHSYHSDGATGAAWVRLHV